jgi:tetratricopeptide (TPR) repeat protein
MLSESIISQTPSQEVWSIEYWDPSAVCDDFAHWTEVLLVPILQKYNLSTAEIVIQSLIRSGALSKLCQILLREASMLFPRSGSQLLYIQALLFNGQEMQALQLLQQLVTTQTIDHPVEILMISLIAHRTGKNLHWTPSLNAAEHEGIPGLRGVSYALDASYDRALTYYTEELSYEDPSKEDLLVQRALIYMIQGDLLSAEKDIDELVEMGELDFYLPLYLTLQWMKKI